MHQRFLRYQNSEMRRLLLVIFSVSCIVCLILSYSQTFIRHYRINDNNSGTPIDTEHSLKSSQDKYKVGQKRKSPYERQRRIIKVTKQLLKRPQQSRKHGTDVGPREENPLLVQDSLKHHEQDRYISLQQRSKKNEKSTGELNYFGLYGKRLRNISPRSGNGSNFLTPQGKRIVQISSPVRQDGFEFIIKNENICVGLTGERILLLVGVYVGLSEKSVRKFIRTNWGSLAKVGSKMRLVFIVGKSANDLEMVKIRNENNVYHDIVQGNFLDTYRNLTLKSLVFFRWSDKYCPSAKYLLKIDSDMKINLPELMRVLQTRNIPDKFICGYIFPKSIVVRDKSDKWYVSFKTYPYEFYPTYCHGAAYIVTQRIGGKIAKIPFPKNPFPIDDAYVSGILRESLHEGIVKGIISFEHHYGPTETYVQEGDNIKYIISVHVDR